MTLIKNRYVTTRALEKKSKQLALCTQCGDIHYKGFWYASDSQFAQQIDEETDFVSHQRCPACEMQNSGAYAGVLKIDHIPEDMLGPVFTVVNKAVEQDIENNPQHRVLDVSVDSDGYTLKTTSARMVRHIGRKVLDTYEACEAKSTYTKDPKPFRITNISFTIPSYFAQSNTNN
jgi:NMD protein affecting ribosome stability and mRNA decay